MKNERFKVAVGLSGGVDSSVAAAMLKESGHQVIGITMEIFDGTVEVKDNEKHACYGPNEAEDVQRAASLCEDLDIPFYRIDLKKEYRKYVIDYFKKEYLAGRTPNPCIVCNRNLKFGFLLEKAKDAGAEFEFFATGHYARIVKSGEHFLLKQAIDTSKDQTYFLYTLRPEQLSRTLFPIGAYTKSRVREIARTLGLETAERPESQDFIAGRDYSALFAKGEVTGGDIVDESGQVIGEHRGIIHYTVGQRRGLGIASRQPLYVVEIDAENNRIVAGDKEKLYAKGLIATSVNLIAMERLDKQQRVTAKIRLNHRGAQAIAFPEDNGRVRLMFDNPQMAVTPGQSAVLYSGDTVLGGGIIEKGL